jgi:hypothetical protein
MRAFYVSLQVIKTKSCNLIAMIISYMKLRKNDTEQIIYSQSRIHRSQQQNTHSPYPNLLVDINCYYEFNTHTLASLNANAF